ncbi:MAG TPA: prepilin-type N-terminal cleavage/methylation domain-containing protein [Thermodesulfovibrionales bacterium]|nr:prepilin-type N-terminal cleavage/methylation domain-containing protein [Thermodesulfovibrionales bacterium]
MMKREDGFTLVELMITMAVLAFSLAAASTVFTALLSQFKQQTKIAETSIEGIVGLEIMRQDIEGAGYGLPWNLGGSIYREAVDDGNTPWADTTMNDGPSGNPGRVPPPPSSNPQDIAGASNPPAAFRSMKQVSMNGYSDVLSVKSVVVAQNSASQKWTQLALGNLKKNGLSGDSFSNPDLVTIIYTGGTTHLLVHNGASNWSTTYANTASFAPGPSPAVGAAADLVMNYPEISASNTLIVFIVYGVDPGTGVASLRMPFNRADFYVRVPAANLPKQCAAGTGVLYKGTFSQSNGTIVNELPILDCVVAMRVIFTLDLYGNGAYTYTDDISGLTAADIRAWLKEVRVYILAQEGQKDPNYTYPNSTVTLGETGMLPVNIDMTTITNYQNYRWKPYTLIVRPTNLR